MISDSILDSQVCAAVGRTTIRKMTGFAVRDWKILELRCQQGANDRSTRKKCFVNTNQW